MILFVILLRVGLFVIIIAQLQMERILLYYFMYNFTLLQFSLPFSFSYKKIVPSHIYILSAALIPRRCLLFVVLPLKIPAILFFQLFHRYYAAAFMQQNHPEL